MPSVLGSDIAYGALADLGVIRPGETPSTTVQADLLLRLNQLLGNLSTEQLMAQTQAHGVYTLTAGAVRYTIGQSGGFSTIGRPIKVTGWRATSGNFQSGGKVVTYEEAQAESQASMGETTALPKVVGADTAYPTINLLVAPIPNGSTTIELTYWAAIATFGSLASTVTLPDGWDRMLRANFAVDLHPRYGRLGYDITTLLKDAQDSKAAIAELNRSQQSPPATA